MWLWECIGVGDKLIIAWKFLSVSILSHLIYLNYLNCSFLCYILFTSSAFYLRIYRGFAPRVADLYWNCPYPTSPLQQAQQTYFAFSKGIDRVSMAAKSLLIVFNVGETT